MWILFAPGAGAPSTSAWMQRFARRLAELCPVETFDYAYQDQGRRRPDPMSQLLATHRAALERGREKHGADVVLAGKSMGGRLGCHLALEQPVRGVLCLGYPLLAMGRPGQIRDQVLLDLLLPALFVQGTRDRLCPLPELASVFERRRAPSELYVVESGDHSLECTKTSLKQQGLTQDQVEQAIQRRVADFLARLT